MNIFRQLRFETSLKFAVAIHSDQLSLVKWPQVPSISHDTSWSSVFVTHLIPRKTERCWCRLVSLNEGTSRSPRCEYARNMRVIKAHRLRTSLHFRDSIIMGTRVVTNNEAVVRRN